MTNFSVQDINKIQFGKVKFNFDPLEHMDTDQFYEGRSKNGRTTISFNNFIFTLTLHLHKDLYSPDQIQYFILIEIGALPQSSLNAYHSITHIVFFIDFTNPPRNFANFNVCYIVFDNLQDFQWSEAF